MPNYTQSWYKIACDIPLTWAYQCMFFACSVDLNINDYLRLKCEVAPEIPFCMLIRHNLHFQHNLCCDVFFMLFFFCNSNSSVYFFILSQCTQPFRNWGLCSMYSLGQYAVFIVFIFCAYICICEVKAFSLNNKHTLVLFRQDKLCKL